MNRLSQKNVGMHARVPAEGIVAVDAMQVVARIKQFLEPGSPAVICTDAPLYIAKARLMPNTSFVVGKSFHFNLEWHARELFCPLSTACSTVLPDEHMNVVWS